MGPERKDKLASPDARERSREELDALLLQSRRLMEEMQVLAAQTRRLTEEHAALARKHLELLQAAEEKRKGEN